MPYRWWLATLAALDGIEPAEVLQALSADLRMPVPGSSLGLPVLSIWARTKDGRPLIVVLHHEDGFNWGIIGARVMGPDEVALFERWEANS